MRIKILAVEIKEVKEGKKDYKIADVSYKNLEFNKVEGKKIVSFANPDVFQALKDAKPGDEFEVTKGEKSAAGFVPWTRCIPVESGSEDGHEEVGRTGISASNQQIPSKNFPRSTYETPEERARKQLYIVRQSSIGYALAFHEPFLASEETPITIQLILSTAKEFEKFVFGKDPIQELMDLDDDIPL